MCFLDCKYSAACMSTIFPSMSLVRVDLWLGEALPGPQISPCGQLYQGAFQSWEPLQWCLRLLGYCQLPQPRLADLRAASPPAEVLGRVMGRACVVVVRGETVFPPVGALSCVEAAREKLLSPKPPKMPLAGIVPSPPTPIPAGDGNVAVRAGYR